MYTTRITCYYKRHGSNIFVTIYREAGGTSTDLVWASSSSSCIVSVLDVVWAELGGVESINRLALSRGPAMVGDAYRGIVTRRVVLCNVV